MVRSATFFCVVILACGLAAGEAKVDSKTYPAPDGLPVFLEADKAVTDYRNLAVNPKACTAEKATSYPHATSNSEYNKKEFAARCAIDGNTANKSVHKCGSWGPHKRDDLWWDLDFGRPVEIDKVIIYVRAAFGHDSYWHSGTIEFSDGSKEDFKLEKTADPQTITLKKRTVSSLRITNLKQTPPKKWCAFCEIQVWGKDAGK